MFPMPIKADGSIGWWSPDPRGVLELDSLHVSRSLRRSARGFEIRINSSLPAVIDACANSGRPHDWIDAQIRDAYVRLGSLGWVHSVETWLNENWLVVCTGLASVVCSQVSRCFTVSRMLPKLRSWRSWISWVTVIDGWLMCSG